MSLQFVAIALTLAGTTIMMMALRPACLICKAQNTVQQKRAWKILAGLICLFIIAYIILTISSITTTQPSTLDLIVSGLLFIGSFFVIIILNLSLSTIQEIKRVAKQQRHDALHDPLTNLPNRALLYETLPRTIAHAKRKNSTLALLLMDLNQFKEINDTLGHHFGDQLLQTLAPRLQKAIREMDFVARLGGDEFAVVLADIDFEGAKSTALRIIECMKTPLSIDSYDLKVGISIGIAQFPLDGQDCDSLIQKADIAMYSAKKDPCHFSIYDPDQDIYSIEKLTITRKLYEAIHNKSLALYFQPIINLHSGRVCSFEALSRWHDEELGIIPPDEFIAVAEQTGLIKELTLWMLDTAISQFQQWQDFNPELQLSVNMTAQDIQDYYLVNNVSRILAKYGFNPEKLHIEITESNMMTNSPQTRETITELHKLGVSLSIDDFGTGFSSLAYLKQLPTQTIKIDKSFVTHLLDNSSDEVIVRSVIDIAHNMGQAVIAEGIEDRHCLEHLQRLNCDFGQGYYFSKPLPVTAVAAWMVARGEFMRQAAS